MTCTTRYPHLYTWKIWFLWHKSFTVKSYGQTSWQTHKHTNDTHRQGGNIISLSRGIITTICLEWRPLCPEKPWRPAFLHRDHDDVIKWKYFPRYWPFVWGIYRSPANSPHKGNWRGALMFSLICAWINGWVNNREAGDLRRHRASYDVTVKQCCSLVGILVHWSAISNLHGYICDWCSNKSQDLSDSLNFSLVHIDQSASNQANVD